MRTNQAATKTAVVYCRVSTTGQKDRETIKAQDSTCERLIAHHGVNVLPYGPRKDGWLRDDGISGSLLEGREFADLIDDLERGRIQPDYVIVPNMSRLARPDWSGVDKRKRIKSQMEEARIYAVLDMAGVRIIDSEGINEPLSLMTSIKRTLSGGEYKAIRERTCAGKARVLDNGAWATGGRVPFGYKRVFVNGENKKQGTTLGVHPKDGERAKQLLGEWYVQGGAAHAARMAEQAGWTAPRGGANWYPSTIQQILKNLPAYLGEKTLRIDGQSFTVKYPALFDLKTYAAISRRFKERTLSKRTTLLGTGFVDCGTCGCHVHGARSSTAQHFHLTCRYHYDCTYRGGCFRMREDVFASALWELVVARLVQLAEQQRRVGNKNAHAEEIDAAKDKLKTVQGKIDRLVELFTDGAIDKAALTKRNQTLKEDKAAILVDIDRLVRERDAKASKQVNEESVHARVSRVLRQLKSERVTLDGQRKILSDLLAGQRVILTKKADHMVVSMPAFGPLGKVTVRLDRPVTQQLHGVSREGLEMIHGICDGSTTLGLGLAGESVA